MSTTDLTLAEKLSRAKQLKDEGNEKFKNDDLIGGLDSSAVASMLPGQTTVTLETKEEIKKYTTIWLVGPTFRFRELIYYAACYIKQERWEKAVSICSKVIEMDANVSKAFYRRSVAYLSLQDVDKAEQDITRASQMDPKDALIRKTLSEIQKLQSENEKKNDQMWKGVYSSNK